MKKIAEYLESKEVIFHGSLALILLYVPHAGKLFMQLEHLDMSVAGFTFLNWVYAIALALVIEFLILVFIINGYQTTGKFYAIVSFFLNAFYYDYGFVAIVSPEFDNIKLAIVSGLICLIHSISIWQLSELFYNRLKIDKEKIIEHWCSECEAGPFPNKRSIDGHISRAHKGKQGVILDKNH